MHVNPTRTTQMSVFVVAVSFCSSLALYAQSHGPGRASPLERSVDASIKPGDDFFAYANGAWLEATEIPQGKERWGARDETNELTRQRIARVFDEARSAPRGSTARKVADFHAAWLNEGAIEARGVSPIKAQLERIESITDKGTLTRALGHRVRADVDPLNWAVYESSSLLGLSVEPSIHGEKTYVAFLLQGGLGLTDRDRYLSADPRMQSLRKTYRDYIKGLLAFGNVDRADQRADAVLALETAIAQSHGTPERSANDHNADTVWTRADFARRAPGIDWSAFLDAAGLAQQKSFVAWQPSALTGVAALIAAQPLEAWKDYLRFHVVAEYADVLPRAVSESAVALRAAMGGQSQASREQRALDATQLAMSDAIGRLYSERYFPAAQKAHVQRIADNVTAAFIKRLEAATWMSPATKKIALAKLHALYVGIGYPEQWQDYSDLTIDPSDAAGNLRRVRERNDRRALARLGKPVDMKEWWIAPQRAGALLVFQQNAYTFAAALLQPPKFDATASDAASYGAIGAIIAHDVTHYVDVLGAEYQVNGAMRRWWTAEDSSRYEAITNPLAEQFSSYRPFPDAAVDGRLTLRENIADLAGLAAAFDAYRLSLGNRVRDKQYVRDHDREFFIAFAQAWRAKLSDGSMRTQLTNDHAPEMYRFNTVRNLDAWYDAFDVRPGQRLYLEPKSRVRIW
ncbi:MAG: M13 family metallopeptidase [Gemmatimonadota bacterium]